MAASTPPSSPSVSSSSSSSATPSSSMLRPAPVRVPTAGHAFEHHPRRGSGHLRDALSPARTSSPTPAAGAPPCPEELDALIANLVCAIMGRRRVSGGSPHPHVALLRLLHSRLASYPSWPRTGGPETISPPALQRVLEWAHGTGCLDSVACALIKSPATTNGVVTAATAVRTALHSSPSSSSSSSPPSSAASTAAVSSTKATATATASAATKAAAAAAAAAATASRRRRGGGGSSSKGSPPAAHPPSPLPTSGADSGAAAGDMPPHHVCCSVDASHSGKVGFFYKAWVCVACKCFFYRHVRDVRNGIPLQKQADPERYQKCISAGMDPEAVLIRGADSEPNHAFQIQGAAAAAKGQALHHGAHSPSSWETHAISAGWARPWKVQRRGNPSPPASHGAAGAAATAAHGQRGGASSPPAYAPVSYGVAPGYSHVAGLTAGGAAAAADAWRYVYPRGAGIANALAGAAAAGTTTKPPAGLGAQSIQWMRAPATGAMRHPMMHHPHPGYGYPSQAQQYAAMTSPYGAMAMHPAMLRHMHSQQLAALHAHARAQMQAAAAAAATSAPIAPPLIMPLGPSPPMSATLTPSTMATTTTTTIAGASSTHVVRPCGASPNAATAPGGNPWDSDSMALATAGKLSMLAKAAMPMRKRSREAMEAAPRM